MVSELQKSFPRNLIDKITFKPTARLNRVRCARWRHKKCDKTYIYQINNINN